MQPDKVFKIKTLEDFRNKKSLGQHFLVDKNIAGKIASALKNAGTGYKNLLEVGPGNGSLTRFLVENPAFTLYLVEKDTELIPVLKSTFPELNDRIIHADFLNFDISRFFGEPTGIIGNFPYNISSQILVHVVEHKNIVLEVVGMFQKELAQRIVSKPGGKTYGRISVLVQTFYEIEYLFSVSRNVFFPKPNVESGVIRLTRKANFDLPCNEKFYIQVVKQAFNQRRKSLKNALSAFGPKLNFVETGILTKRAEQLSIEDFISLASKLQNL